MSLDFLQKANEPIRWKKAPAGDEYTWRGTLEMSLLREFLTDVKWGELDVLLLDVPPGSDRLVNLASLLSPERMILTLVTLPSVLSQGIVEKSFLAAQDKKLPIKGLIENMKGFLCPQCRSLQPFFSGDASDLAQRLDTAYLGGIPFDPAWSRLGDEGKLWDYSVWHEPVREAFDQLVKKLFP
jgi:ATP-binding protein involved in chromosome partitioning